MVKSVKLILLLIIWCSAEAANINSQLFTAVNDCTCLEYNSVYECTVTGGIATVWKGTAFDCQLADNEVVLLHNTNSTSLTAETCNNGAITGRIIKDENGTYTSQLVVRVIAEMNGSTIVCAHDTGIDTPVINSTVLTITQAPFPAPTNIQLVEANYTHLSFNWTQVSLNCPSLQYHIVASNCGECPSTTTNNMVTCTGNYTQLMNDRQCSFAVQTVVCNCTIVGDVSTVINVRIESGITSTNNITSSLDTMCSQGATLSSSTIIIFGAVTGALFIVMLFIILSLTATTVILIKSKRALCVEFNLLQAKMKDRPEIYEEIAQLQDSLKSSSPPIDVGENTAYVSAISMNACVRACAKISM